MSKTMVRGDRLPTYRVTLTQDNTPVNLTGATARFRMWADGAATNKVDALMTLVDAAGGVVDYAWAVGDTDTVGVYRSEVEVTFADGRQRTWEGDTFYISETRG